ncbi:MAG: ABC transporter ATP-binding protein [Flavobacteriales bacterium]
MRSLRHLNKYFLKYKWRFLLGILFIVASNIFAVKAPQVVQEAIDKISEMLGEYEKGPSTGFQEKVTEYAIGFAGLYLLYFFLKGFFLFLTRQTIIVMSRFIEYDLKNEIYAHYQTLTMGFYKRNNTGDLMNRITEDVTRVRMYLGPAVMYTINLLVLFIMAISVMVRMQPWLTLYILTPLPVLSVIIYFISSVINRKSERVQRQQSRLSTFVQEVFSGIRVLKAYDREACFHDRFEKESELYRDRSVDLARTNAYFMPAVLLLIGLSTILTIYLGGVWHINGEGNVTLGTIASFVIYVNMLTWPFASVGWVTSLVQRAAASQERINEFLRTEPEVTDPENGLKPDIQGSITFEKVSFSYPDSGIKALNELSFRIETGKTLAVIGRTGAGKSTIADLLIRQYDPDDGRIMVDGVELREMSLESLRSNIGYAPQEVFLFSDSIRNNIAFGVGEASDEAVEQAAADADVLDNIQATRDRFDTLLGERGVTLSGGQKQRLSIARAIIREPRILIFDDCLSAVDTETEDTILQNLDRLMEGRTTLIISHRVSSVKRADRIVVLDRGEKIEEGSHEELVRKGGHYAEMHRKQLLEEGVLES